MKKAELFIKGNGIRTVVDEVKDFLPDNTCWVHHVENGYGDENSNLASTVILFYEDLCFLGFTPVLLTAVFSFKQEDTCDVLLLAGGARRLLFGFGDETDIKAVHTVRDAIEEICMDLGWEYSVKFFP